MINKGICFEHYFFEKIYYFVYLNNLKSFNLLNFMYRSFKAFAIIIADVYKYSCSLKISMKLPKNFLHLLYILFFNLNKIIKSCFLKRLSHPKIFKINFICFFFR